MHGPLSEIGLIEVLQLLQRGAQSGLLRINGARDDAHHTLRISRGQIVALEPGADDEAVRAGLQRRCLLDPASADEGDALHTPHALKLREALAAAALVAMVQWHEGRFDFEAGASSTGPLALSPDAVVFRLVAAETRRIELAAMLGNFLLVPAFPEYTDEPRAIAHFETLDWRILDQVDGQRNIAEIAALLLEPVEDVAARIQVMQGALILELHQVAERALQVATASRGASGPDDGWRARGLAEAGAGRFEAAIDAWQQWQSNDPAHATDAVMLMQAARTMMEALRDARD